eukprot:TRINITY_DN64375_c0_g1_i1.p1 TRINITY_DN64375_c0_g1~~TRINITY_DN64375_c0_g1_i1.p1  ORF type:complete len:236 (-),score=6.21 TRINITY_DN64375_c0_g1_i1:49-735(-)
MAELHLADASEAFTIPSSCQFLLVWHSDTFPKISKADNSGDEGHREAFFRDLTTATTSATFCWLVLTQTELNFIRGNRKLLQLLVKAEKSSTFRVTTDDGPIIAAQKLQVPSSVALVSVRGIGDWRFFLQTRVEQDGFIQAQLNENTTVYSRLKENTVHPPALGSFVQPSQLETLATRFIAMNSKVEPNAPGDNSQVTTTTKNKPPGRVSDNATVEKTVTALRKLWES